MKKQFSVKELASLAGVTVRTLHLYDGIGLLSPASRTNAGYRWYGEAELLRLQQILFYRELDMPLKEIAAILDDPDFNLETALENHRRMLQHRRERISIMLQTIEKTFVKLKQATMKDYKELYEGFPPEEAEALHNEAVEKYGDNAVKKAEVSLGKLSKEQFTQLGKENEEIVRSLLKVVGESPESDQVQVQIDRHYNIIRRYWGTAGSADTQAAAYKGLGELYVSDERFTTRDGQANPVFAIFLRDAMAYYADHVLK